MDDLRQSAHLVVLVVAADVEGLVMDRLEGGRQRCDKRAGDVFDMYQRPPGRPVAEDAHFSGRVRPADEIIEHQVRPPAWRHSVGGRVAEIDRRECAARQFRQGPLQKHLRFRVRGQRPQRCFLRQRAITVSSSIHAARRREQKSPDSRRLGQDRQPKRGEVIDLVCQFGAQAPSGSFESAAR